MAGLRRAGCFAAGIFKTQFVPYELLCSGLCKGIGLAFDKNSYINRLGDSILKDVLETPKYFKGYPDILEPTKITGSETHYDIYDEETVYYSNGEIEKRKIHIRPQDIRNNEQNQ